MIVDKIVIYRGSSNYLFQLVISRLGSLCTELEHLKNIGPTMAQWIHLCFPSCGPGF